MLRHLAVMVVLLSIGQIVSANEVPCEQLENSDTMRRCVKAEAEYDCKNSYTIGFIQRIKDGYTTYFYRCLSKEIELENICD